MIHERHHPMIISLVVALVAVVGLATPLNKSGGTSLCGDDGALQLVANDGGQAFYACMPKPTDVSYINHEGDSGTSSQSFETVYQKKEREEKILTGDWKY